MSLRHSVLVLALLVTGCPTPGEYMEVEPEAAVLRPGESVVLVVRHGIRGWERGDPQPSPDLEVGLHDGALVALRPAPDFVSGRDRVANPGSTTAPPELQPRVAMVPLETECGPRDGDYVCEGRFEVSHAAPGRDDEITFRFLSYAVHPFGGRIPAEEVPPQAATAVITFTTESTPDAGPPEGDAGPGPADAGVDAGEGDACAALICENGARTTDPEGACHCECEPGYRGERCDRRDPVVSTLPGAFADPRGLAVDGSTLLVVSGLDGAVERVAFDGSGRTTVLAGAPGRRLLDVAVADDGTIYVVSSSAPRLNRVVDGALVPVPVELYGLGGIAWIDGALWLAAGTQVGTLDTSGASPALRSVAGNPFDRRPRDGVGALATFGETLDLAGASGAVFVGDSGAGFGGAVRRLATSTTEVSTIYGADGLGPNDRAGSGWVEVPIGLAVHPSGDVYVAERGAHRVRRFYEYAPGTWLAENVAGDPWTGTTDRDGTPGQVDGPGDVARFASPSSLAITPDGGRLFVADADNDAVRVIAL